MSNDQLEKEEFLRRHEVQMRFDTVIKAVHKIDTTLPPLPEAISTEVGHPAGVVAMRNIEGQDNA